MKKTNLFLSCLYIYLTASSGLCTEVDRFNGYDHNDGKSRIYLKMTVEERSQVLKISAADLNITDDSIVEAIKHPRPLSVSEVLESIQNECLQPTTKGKLLGIDLSSNTICDQGAGLIGNYFKNNNSLMSLDLSWNRMTDDGIMNLVTLLKPILIQPIFNVLNIKGNYGANVANIKKILTSFTHTEQGVVRSKIQI